MTSDPLAPFVAAPASAALFTDFDGVLADIAPRPDEAFIRPGLDDLLAALHERLGRVAVVTGRPVAFVDPMVPAAIDIVGLYGLEWRHEGDIHQLDEAQRWRGTIDEVVDAAAGEFGAAAVEPKGVSLTLHYRTGAANGSGRDRMEVWVHEQAVRTGLEARPAKASFELHPPLERDKGTVVVDLAAGLDPVAYLGDDLGDLPAFDGLDRLAADGVDTLRVAVGSDEAPRALLERADHVVAGPGGAEELLRRLLARLDG